MTWLKVSDDFLRHRKLEEFDSCPLRWARNIAVWLACANYAADCETDGKLNLTRVRRRVHPDVDFTAALDDLVQARLIEVVEGEYWVHNFLRYNESHATLERRRERSRARQAKYRQKQEVCNGVTNAVSNRGTYQKSFGVSNAPPDPTRPDLAKARSTPQTPQGDLPTLGKASPADGSPIPELPKWLKRQRRKTKLSQAQLAGYCHVRRELVSEWERGLATPTAEQQARLVEVFEARLKPSPRAIQLATAAIVVVNTERNRNYPVTDEIAAIARSWADADWTADELGAAIRLRIAAQKTPDVHATPKTLFNGQLAKYVEDVRAGAKPTTTAGDNRRPVERGPDALARAQQSLKEIFDE